MATLSYLTTPQDVVASPDDAVTMQLCRDALAVVQGEWFFNPTEGVPLFGEWLVKAPDTDRARAVVRRLLLGVTGGTDFVLNADGDLALVNGDFIMGTGETVVDAVVEASVEAPSRRLLISFTAYTATGRALADTLVVAP